MSSLTSNFSFYLPANGDGALNSRQWGALVAANFTAIDTQIKTTNDSAVVLTSRVSAVETGQSAAVVGYDTQANLYANLVPADKSVAYVTNDSTPSKNGTYRKSGATGTGSWIQSSYDRVAVVETRANLVHPGDILSPSPAFLRYKDGVSTTSSSLIPALIAAIQSIKVTGSDPTKPHKLRFFARNDATHHWRFIVAMKTGSTWADILDSTTAFTVTENTGGATTVTYTSGYVTVTMSVNYSGLSSAFNLVLEGGSWASVDPYFIINPANVFSGEPGDVPARLTTVEAAVAANSVLTFPTRYFDPMTPTLGEAWLLVASTLNANYPSAATSGTSIYINSAHTQNTRIFQSFLATASGVLAAVRVMGHSRLASYNVPTSTIAGDLRIAVCSDSSGAVGAEIAYSVVPAFSTPADGDMWIAAEGWSAPVSLVSGTHYWLKFEIINVPTSVGIAYTFLYGSGYSDGQRATNLNGGTITYTSGSSIGFEVYIR